ncbi:hypothetical protein ECC02_013831 [Trypanosoma cruzi]|uniref:Uncharacterized protein n=1 Tax=Trypanosoma cruzi TaxID=5693 RepID=A0A7J6XH89_TRYCR|nr:hypothetical protein ECC02_013831 [Trypanosoma cruzi]
MDERTPPQVGKEDVNPPLAGRQKFAAFTSGGPGGSSGGPTSSIKKGRRHRHRVPCDLQGACGPVEERAGVASHLRAVPPLGARCPGRHQEQSPCHTDKRLSRGVCGFLFLPHIFQYSRLTAARKPTCQALTQSCGRDRAMTASASAVTLRGIPQSHEENVEPTVRPRSASESGTVELSSVTSLCAASEPRRIDSIAERESVATGTRAGDWDAAARRGTENCLRPC